MATLAISQNSFQENRLSFVFLVSSNSHTGVVHSWQVYPKSCSIIKIIEGLMKLINESVLTFYRGTEVARDD